jgi:omega-hydroxy-beta-dihydromenaquinone-9 sulfotransferase
MSEFKIPPISTLAGSTLFNYFSILKQGHVHPRYYFKICLTTLVILLATPFHIWERIYFKRKLAKATLEEPPLFILGHWRSGTTLLHNLLTKDPNVGYMTTYQSVFPNNLASKWIFKTFMRINMPHERPSDRVELNINFPQEDEFAFCNSQSNGYYNFFYFPKQYRQFYNRSVHHDKLSEKQRKLWYATYDTMLNKALINTDKKRLVVKNPINTARVEKLLKLYPDAKFLYLYRNPITVFYSTQRFFQQIFPSLWLDKVDKEFITHMIIDVYNLVMNDYLEQKALIPPENLIELKFEDFEKQPMAEIEKIYNQLWKEDFAAVKPYFSYYLETQKKHKKNKYKIESAEMEMIQKHLGKPIELYGYSIPPEVIVTDTPKKQAHV